MELREMPLAEIRRRWVSGATGIPQRVLDELRRDARRGARELAAELEERRSRRRAERRRVSRLFALERTLQREGALRVAGVDEVGVGPLAGPVVAAAVVLPARAELCELNDSKQLAAPERERLAAEIRSTALGLALGWATPEEIDRLNIYRATLLAMRRAVEGLDPAPDSVLVDGRAITELPIQQRAVVGGDARVASIAAASIVAKVYRDAWLSDLDRRYPGYGFAHNAGYGTAEHRRALERLGPTPAHRYSFAPVREACARRGA